MTTRIISALVALAIVVPALLMGGMVYKVGVYLLSLLAMWEFINMKQTKKELPIFIKLISYIFLSFFVWLESTGLTYAVDFRILIGLFLATLLPVTLYHDKNLYSINDAFYMLGGIFFLGTAFHVLILIRDIRLELMIYLLIITITTDTFAYITGSLIGRKPLLQSISPNKTWEGFFGGTIMGVFLAVCYYHTVIDSTLAMFPLILITIFLSILGQFGDLTFSSIKRYFGKKDFSSIMPGHGGILDRLDSIIFVVLGFLLFYPML